MISSEAVILNKGIYSSGIWNNVSIQIRYPNVLPNGIQQSTVDNKLTVGDIIVDNNGFNWKIISCTYAGSNDYICSLQQDDITPTQYMEPSTTEKCIASTPNSKGLLAPYYHDSYVSTNSFRAAMSYNMKKYEINIDGPIPVIPASIQKLFKWSNILIINDINNYSWFLGHETSGAPLNLYSNLYISLFKNNVTNEVFKIKHVDTGIYSAYFIGAPASMIYGVFPFIRNSDLYSYISQSTNVQSGILGHDNIVEKSSVNKQDGEQSCTKIISTYNGLYLKLGSDNKLYYGGNNSIIQLSNTNYYNRYGSDYYLDISAGYNTIYMILLNGVLISYGDNSLYQRGFIGNVDYVGSMRFKKIYTYMESVYAIDQNDYLWFWGRDGQGLNKTLRSDNTGYTALPLQISTTIKFTKVSIGKEHCLALSTTGDVYAWGVCNYYCIGNSIHNSGTIQSTPYKITSNCIDCMAMPSATSYYATSTGELYGIGYNYNRKSFGYSNSGYDYLNIFTRIT